MSAVFILGIVATIFVVIAFYSAGIGVSVVENTNVVSVRVSSWGVWSVCSVTCAVGKKQRKRSCDGIKSKCKEIKLEENDDCDTGTTCPLHGGWGEWQTWEDCPVQCGGSLKSAQRMCDKPAPQEGGIYCRGMGNKTKACNVNPCPVDGSWSLWKAWESCDVTCDSGDQKRSRTCDDPEPKYGGSSCNGMSVEYVACDTGSPCPVHGNWTNWSVWDSCSTQCGPGIQTRTRGCTMPAPEHGGNDCPDSDTDTKNCELMPCPVNGVWNEWTEWSLCSEVCEGGYQKRKRTCDNPAPEHGGNHCPEEGEQSRACNGQTCPLYGNWSPWGQWGGCTVTCDGGTSTRTRTCTDPGPENGGNFCYGQGNEDLACNENPCPIDGEWSNWSPWSTCTKSCAGGTQKSERSCTDPAPAHGGLDCVVAPTLISQDCNTQHCPIHGGWTEWSAWGDCSLTCNLGTQTATRTCTNPPKQYGGDDCAGSGTKSQNCGPPCPIDGVWDNWEAWSTCSKSCETGTQERFRACIEPKYGGLACPGIDNIIQNCNPHPCPIDGVWSPWAPWGQCSATCPGTQSTSRTCTNPAPDHGGLDCKEQATKTQACNAHVSCPIHGGWGHWSATSCTKSCAGGTQTKTRSCSSPSPLNGGNTCPGSSSLTEPCNTYPCPINGVWSPWPWSACTKSCGTGSRSRSRTCTNPAPQFYGLPCVGITSETEDCNTHHCPIHGGWSNWSGWSSCSLTCYIGVNTRTRSCNNPTPQYNGNYCAGAGTETRPCDTGRICGNCAEEYYENKASGYCDGTITNVASGDSTTRTCKKKGGHVIQNSPVKCRMVLCESGWTYNYHGDACYLYNSASQNWPDGERYCNNFGAHLASINSASEQSFLTQFAGERIFFGLNDIASEGSWRNVDGTPHSYSNWNSGEPNNSGNEDCAELLTDARWNDIPCHHGKRSICERITYKFIDCVNPEYFWNKFTERCYRLATTKQTWDQAKATCQADGATLASVVGGPEQIFVGQLLVEYGTHGGAFHWIGIKGSSWLDGTTMSGAVIGSTGSNCGAVYTSGALGTSRACSETNNFICEMTPDATKVGKTIT